MKRIFILFNLFLLFGCSDNFTPEQKEYINSIETERANKNLMMKTNPNSPFNQDPKAHFSELKYFDVNPDFVFTSKLFQYNPKDTIIIYGTKGEERKTVKFGYFNLEFKDKTRKLNVYQSKSGMNEYFSLWFTDLSTNEETYGVGRYIDFEYEPNPDFVYNIDFNKAFNPYCAYSSNYSCAIPSKEDFLDVYISAGEKKFHD